MNEDQVIYIWHNLSLLLVSNINTSMHSHYALEIYIALKSYFQMDFGKGFKKYDSLIINSNIPHKFSGNNGAYALILINPNHNLANILLNNILNGNSFRELDLNSSQYTLEEISNLYKEPLSYINAKDLVQRLLKDLTKDFTKISIMDPRIKKTISFIHSSYKKTITLSYLASLIDLSPSRMRHLFKEETGITIRQYILNMRIIEAVKLIINDCSKTYAAYETGFSDSAHLSRTFRKIYGLTLSDLYKNNQNKHIHFCSEQNIE